MSRALSESSTPAAAEGYRTDPVTMSVIMHAFLSIVKEMGITMERTSRSPILAEARDFSCAILNHACELVTQEEDKVIPIQCGGASLSTWNVADFFGDEIYPGDLMILNDPYSGGNHLADVTILLPVFAGDQHLFWTYCRAHHADIGGNAAGTYNPRATEIFQEGIRIPPLKIYERGKLRKDVFNMLLKNVRYERLQLGDFRAQMGATRVGARRIQELIEKHSLATVQAAVGDLIDYAERRMRREIEKIPDGVYVGESILDDDGHGAESINIRATLAVKGSDLSVDLSGSHPQVKGFINSSLSNTYSAVYLAIMSSVDPSIPHNEGCFKPITISAPYGTVVNAACPAPVAMCTVDVAAEIIEACWKALARAVPEQVSAGWDRCASGTTHGVDPRNREPYAFFHLQYQGGAGAVHGMDGWNHLGPVIGLGGQTAPSIEMTEIKYPFLTLQHELRRNSGGPGRWRGGLGIVYRLQSVDCETNLELFGDGAVNPPFGLAGGKPGAPNRQSLVRRDGQVEPLPTKGPARLGPGDVWMIESAGGGGWGDPFERPAEVVQEDVRQGYVTRESALDNYGVVIDPTTLAVDEMETRRRRRTPLIPQPLPPQRGEGE